MKAEELKRNAYKKCKIFVESKWIDIEYHFTEKELEQYANEVSRKAIEDYAEYVDTEHWKRLVKRYYFFHEWKSK